MLFAQLLTQAVREEEADREGMERFSNFDLKKSIWMLVLSVDGSRCLDINFRPFDFLDRCNMSCKKGNLGILGE